MAKHRKTVRRVGWVRRVFPYLRVQPGSLLLAFGAVALAGGCSALLLLVQRDVLDLAIRGDLAAMRLPLTLLVGLGVVIYAFQRIGAYRELKAANQAQFRLYDAVHRRMQEIDAGGQQLSPGQLAARLNTDIGALSRAVSALPKLGAVALSTLGTAVLMFALNPLLGAVTALVVPLLVLVVRRSRRKIAPATWTAQQSEGEVAQLVNEAIVGVRVVKAFGQEQREVERMKGLSAVLYAARLRVVRLQAVFQPILESLSTVIQVVVVILGGWLVLRGHLTIGTFLAFTAYSGQLVGTVKWYADTILELQEAGVCANRVLDLLDLPPAVTERPNAVPLPPLRGQVEFRHVRFAYPDAEPVLDGFQLTVAPGETVALVGANGSGKSTVVKMLARFQDAQLGSVRLDGYDVRDVTVASLRSQVGVVFDDPLLFTGTLRDNIAYGRPTASQAEIEEAARIAGAHDFIADLPDGYDTLVGERGQNFSGGQRQRVALARTLLTQPRVLVLDDATGAVDPRLEREIHRRLREASVGRTTIFVGYRPSTMAAADRIVVVASGRVLDQGSHEELWARCAAYRRLIDPVAARAPEPGSPAGADIRIAGVTPAAWPGTATPKPEVVEAPALAEMPPGPFAIRSLIRPHRTAFAIAFGLLMVQTGIGVFGPYLTRRAIDYGVLAGSLPGLLQAAAAILAVSVVGLLMAPATLLLTGKVGQRVIYALRARVWAHLVRLPIAYFERQKTGRLLTRMVNDVEAFSDLMSAGVITATVSGLTVLGVLAAMLTVSPLLAGLVVSMLLPFVATLWLLNRRIVAAYGRAREQVADANAALQENLAGIREAQAFGQQDRQHEQYRVLIRRYLDSRLAAERLIATSFPITSLLGGLASALVLDVGAVMLVRGSLSAGELIAFVLWINVLFPPLLALAGFYSDIKRVQVSAGRIRELLAEEAGMPSVSAPAPVGALRGQIGIIGARFRYPSARVDALKGVNLSIRPGETIAFVGETGAGKSTIVKLMARFYDPTSGLVTVDGADLRSLDLSGFRARLGYIPQEAFLFSGTIRDNIAYGRPDATDAEIEAAARAVGAHEGIRHLPNGYLTVAGERGGLLSAGLRQLVCLARAYLVDPAIVLLDEATANLDLATEARVLDAMRAVSRGRTTVMIAHRIQTAMEADRIAVVAGGEVVELGTHEELLARGGRYVELYESSVLPGRAAAILG